MVFLHYKREILKDLRVREMARAYKIKYKRAAVKEYYVVLYNRWAVG